MFWACRSCWLLLYQQPHLELQLSYSNTLMVFQPRKRYEGWWRVLFGVGTCLALLVEDEEALKRTESRTGSRARDVQISWCARAA